MLELGHDLNWANIEDNVTGIVTNLNNAKPFKLNVYYVIYSAWYLVVNLVAHDLEILDSIPATSKLFSEEPAILKFVWCQRTHK